MAQQAQTPESNLTEMLRQAAREKEIDFERWVAALEDAMASAAKKQHRIKEPVRAHMDRETGKFEAFIVKQVVEEVTDPAAEWSVEEAQDHRPGAVAGDEILLPVSTEGLGRIAAQSAKQVLYQRVREAEREKIYNEYIDRVGEIVNGTVKRFERRDIIVDLGRTEAIVPLERHQSRSERYSQGERIRAVIHEVHKQPKGPQVVLSRTSTQLLIKLFEMEVPEIYDGTVVIKNAVRAPGERAKVAVYSRERDVDPVGACVGMKGSRVQAIIRELRGEKIDIIEYSDDLVTFAQSALAPAKITRVSVHQQATVPHLDVIVEDEQLALAIGKRGQNVRLASELIGCRIDIKSESDVKGEVADALARLLQTELAAAAPPPDLKVEAFGWMWAWEFVVDGESRGPRLELPAGKLVEFAVSARDVNHGFGIYDPQGRLVAQTQAMPGYVNPLRVRFDEPGTYHVLCLEYCGLGHAVMMGEISVQ